MPTFSENWRRCEIDISTDLHYLLPIVALPSLDSSVYVPFSALVFHFCARDQLGKYEPTYT